MARLGARGKPLLFLFFASKQKGAFCLEHYRIPKSILTHELFKRPLAHRLFELIVGKACYKGSVQMGSVTIGRGQWLRSKPKLQEDLAYFEGEKEVKPSFKKLVEAQGHLERFGLITSETRGKFGTLFTIVHFDIYQGSTLSHREKVNDLAFPTGKPNLFPQGKENPSYLFPQGKHIEEIKTINKVSNKLHNNIRVNNIREGRHNERDSSAIEWERYDFGF